MYRERALKFLGFSQEIQLQFKEDKTCREC